MEVFFLEEWIEHHLNLGFNKIFIYNNGFTSIDGTIAKSFFNYGSHTNVRPLNKSEENVKWKKKPEADYFLDYSDAEIEDKLYSVVNKYEEVFVKKWWCDDLSKVHWSNRDPACKAHHPCSQHLGYVDCTENNESDWWIMIDPDEYLKINSTHRTIQDFLEDEDYKYYSAFRIDQRVFAARERGKKVRKVYNYAYDLKLPKTLVKTPIRWLATPGTFGLEEFENFMAHDFHYTDSWIGMYNRDAEFQMWGESASRPASPTFQKNPEDRTLKFDRNWGPGTFKPPRGAEYLYDILRGSDALTLSGKKDEAERQKLLTYTKNKAYSHFNTEGSDHEGGMRLPNNTQPLLSAYSNHYYPHNELVIYHYRGDPSDQGGIAHIVSGLGQTFQKKDYSMDKYLK